MKCGYSWYMVSIKSPLLTVRSRLGKQSYCCQGSSLPHSSVHEALRRVKTKINSFWFNITSSSDIFFFPTGSNGAEYTVYVIPKQVCICYLSSVWICISNSWKFTVVFRWEMSRPEVSVADIANPLHSYLGNSLRYTEQQWSSGIESVTFFSGRLLMDVDVGRVSTK